MSLVKLKALGLSYLNDDLYASFIKKLADETFHQGKSNYNLEDIDGMGNRIFSDDLEKAITMIAHKDLEKIYFNDSNSNNFMRLFDKNIIENLISKIIDEKSFNLIKTMMETNEMAKNMLESQLTPNKINSNFHNYAKEYSIEEKREIIDGITKENPNKDYFIRDIASRTFYEINYNIDMVRKHNDSLDDYIKDKNIEINNSLYELLQFKDYDMKNLFLDQIRNNNGLDAKLKVLMFKNIDYNDKEIFNFIKENTNSVNIFNSFRVVKELIPNIELKDFVKISNEFVNPRGISIKIENNTKKNLDTFSFVVDSIKNEKDSKFQNNMLAQFKENFKLDKSFSLNDLNFTLKETYDIYDSIFDSIDISLLDSTNKKDLEEEKQKVFNEDLMSLN